MWGQRLGRRAGRWPALLSLVWLALAIAAAGMLSGCSTFGPTIAINSHFDPAAAAFINGHGKAKISGQAFYRDSDGKTLKAAGTDITLLPRTPYADERMAAIYGDGKIAHYVRLEDSDPRYEQMLRTVIADLSGKFTFTDVANGEYYVTAEIPMRGSNRYFYAIMDRVTVKNGKSVRLFLRGY